MSKLRSLEYEKRSLIKLSTKAIGVVRVLASIVTTVLVIKILWDLLSEFNLSSNGAWQLARATVVVYFWSWFLAALKGIEVQSLLLNTADGSDRIPLAGYFALCVGFPISLSALILVLYAEKLSSFVSMFWSGSLIELLLIVLAVFWVWDMIWQWSVQMTMRSRIDKTKRNLAGPPRRHFEQEQLVFLEAFLFGRWRLTRKLIGAIFICILVVIAITQDSTLKLPYTNHELNVDSMIAVSTFGFVVVSEAWTWMMRHRLLIGIDAVESLGRKYNLSLKAARSEDTGDSAHVSGH